MSALAILDTWLHGGAAALFVLLGVRLLRQGWRVPAARNGAWFALGTAAYALQSTAGAAGPWVVPLQLLSAGNTVAFWLFAAACFDDEFRPSWRHGVIWLATVALGAACAIGHRPLACLAFEAVMLLFVILAVREALIGRGLDLMEGRRRFRLVLVAIAATFTVANLLGEVLAGGAAPSGWPGLANSLGLFAIAVGVAIARLRYAEPEAITAAPAAADLLAEPEAAPDPQEAKLLAGLERLMRDERIYREPGLSVAGLAGKLGLPEYRLRRLINQRLGQRNFSAYVNGYRLAEVKQALADPDQAAVPILTIALDAGFQSLGPFNRAFKAATGLTPSDYRRQTGSPNPESASPA